MSSKLNVAIAAGALMVGLAGSATALELTQGRVLTFHSETANGCPGLDWHVVVGANNQLSGIIAWDNMKDVSRVIGVADKEGKFHLDLQPINGVGNTGTVDGQFPDHNGWLTAHVMGAGCPTEDVKVAWSNTNTPSGG